MADRYYVETPIDGPQACLTGAEAHHLAHVMRAKPGTEVTLFDGRGAQFSARVERVGRSEIELAILVRSEISKEMTTLVTLGVALPKGDRQRWLVEKAVELGVARLVPLETDRSDRESPTGSERLRRAVIEASKQCGRNRLMEIATPQRLPDFLAAPFPGEPSSEDRRLLAQPGAPDCRELLTALTPGVTGRIALVVGPEGGFREAELVRAIAPGWQPVGLGPRILRIETAAIALAAIVMIHAE